jgi:hypothetical protein
VTNIKSYIEIKFWWHHGFLTIKASQQGPSWLYFDELFIFLSKFIFCTPVPVEQILQTHKTNNLYVLNKYNLFHEFHWTCIICFNIIYLLRTIILFCVFVKFLQHLLLYRKYKSWLKIWIKNCQSIVKWDVVAKVLSSEI